MEEMQALVVFSLLEMNFVFPIIAIYFESWLAVEIVILTSWNVATVKSLISIFIVDFGYSLMG